MKHFNVIGVSASALFTLGFFGIVAIANTFEHSVEQSLEKSSSIAIHRSEIIDTDTGSIVHISSLKRN